MSALRKAPPTVTLDPLAAKLTALGPDYPASCLPELVDQATRDELSPTSFLDLVLGAELERKDERRVTTMLKLSGLPPGKTLEDFDWSFQPRVDRRQIETLATCSYLREKTNVLFLGPPGVGKSHCEIPMSLWCTGATQGYADGQRQAGSPEASSAMRQVRVPLQEICLPSAAPPACE